MTGRTCSPPVTRGRPYGTLREVSLRGAYLVIENCPQAWIDANIRIVGEEAKTLSNAAPASQGLDAIYRDAGDSARIPPMLVAAGREYGLLAAVAFLLVR